VPGPDPQRWAVDDLGAGQPRPRLSGRSAARYDTRREPLYVRCAQAFWRLVSARSGDSRPVDFEHPPINEVVFSVQFDGPVIDEVGVLSEFWQTIREDFPRHEKQPPLPPASETFDVPPHPPELQFQLLPAGLPIRYWFLSHDGTRIVQVQPDRLMFNWRQVTGSEDYPHYDALAPCFDDLLRKFLACDAVDDQAAKVSWIELQYINPIQVQESHGTHGQLARILNFLVPDPSRTTLTDLEDTQLQQRFRIIDDETGEPQGRLYLTAVPAFRANDQAPLYVITLLARGKPAPGELIAGVNTFIDKAHDLIVDGFLEVTTDEMHQQWGQIG
jgi:uncharacterized protein (TIGR04255 family)